MAFLICQMGGGNYVDFELPPKPLTIGRSPQADLQIADERISRIHCGIRFESGTFILKDLGSTNGTWVNESRVQEARLRFGDAIRVGHFMLSFESKPRGQATSRLPQVIEVELPAKSFSEAMHQLSDEAVRAPQPSATPPLQQC